MTSHSRISSARTAPERLTSRPQRENTSRASQRGAGTAAETRASAPSGVHLPDTAPRHIRPAPLRLHTHTPPQSPAQTSSDLLRLNAYVAALKLQKRRRSRSRSPQRVHVLRDDGSCFARPENRPIRGPGVRVRARAASIRPFSSAAVHQRLFLLRTDSRLDQSGTRAIKDQRHCRTWDKLWTVLLWCLKSDQTGVRRWRISVVPITTCSAVSVQICIFHVTRECAVASGMT